jgi:hypothetical protein
LAPRIRKEDGRTIRSFGIGSLLNTKKTSFETLFIEMVMVIKQLFNN